MALPVTIPNEFANATASIPLSQLDTNFTTLANAVNGISDGSETLANASVTVLTAGTANVTTLNTSGQVVFNDAGADVDFRVESDTIASALFVEGSSGNVGIGTSSPSSSMGTGLHIVTTSGDSLILQKSTGAAIQFRSDASTIRATVSAINGADGLTIGTGAAQTERFRIDASGNLLVGTTSLISAERLSVFRSDVTGSAIIQNIQNNGATSTSKTASPLLRISSNGNGADSCMQITDNVANNYYFGGNLAGAYVSANSQGVRLSSGGTSWASDSDERIKDIIEPITDGLNKVNSLRSVIGKYKTDDEDKRRVFLIAQDVQAVLPEAVFENEDTLMLQYTDVIPLLVAAIKELKAELDTVKAELATLKG